MTRYLDILYVGELIKDTIGLKFMGSGNEPDFFFNDINLSFIFLSRAGAGSLFSSLYVLLSESIADIFSSYSFLSKITVAFPLSAGKIIIDSSFLSSFKAFLSSWVIFVTEILVLLRTPINYQKWDNNNSDYS